MTDRLFLAGIVLVVAGAVIAGLVLSGGPMQGRRDKLDSRRYADLERLAAALACRHWGLKAGELPAELTVDALTARCPSSAHQIGTAIADNETGRPYEYRRRSDTAFSVCAVFHDPARIVKRPMPPLFFRIEGKTGCLEADLR